MVNLISFNYDDNGGFCNLSFSPSLTLCVLSLNLVSHYRLCTICTVQSSMFRLSVTFFSSSSLFYLLLFLILIWFFTSLSMSFRCVFYYLCCLLLLLLLFILYCNEMYISVYSPPHTNSVVNHLY